MYKALLDRRAMPHRIQNADCNSRKPEMTGGDMLRRT